MKHKSYVNVNSQIYMKIKKLEDESQNTSTHAYEPTFYHNIPKNRDEFFKWLTEEIRKLKAYDDYVSVEFKSKLKIK